MWICTCGEHLADIQPSCTSCGTVRTHLYARGHTDEAKRDAGIKRCPYCAEEIQTTAAKCRYCGEWLSVEVGPALESHTPATIPASTPAAETTKQVPIRSPPWTTAAPPQNAPPIQPVDPHPQLGFGGSLWGFFFYQWFVLLFILATVSLPAAFDRAPTETSIKVGWAVLGIVVAMLLVHFTGRPLPVRLVMIFLTVTFLLKLALLIKSQSGLVGGYGGDVVRAAIAGEAKGEVVSTAWWLWYFTKSKHVRATYYPHLAEGMKRP